MNVRIVPLSLLLLWSVQRIQTSDGSAGAMHSDPNEGNALMDDRRPLQVKPNTVVDIPVGRAADLQCRSESGEGKQAVPHSPPS